MRHKNSTSNTADLNARTQADICKTVFVQPFIIAQSLIVHLENAIFMYFKFEAVDEIARVFMATTREI